jgi:hypothetical protein
MIFLRFFLILYLFFLRKKGIFEVFGNWKIAAAGSHLLVSAFRAEAHLSEPPLHLALCITPCSTGRGNARHACAAL